MQKPHWLPPVAHSACDQSSTTSGAKPSTVVTERPAMRRTGVTHATRAAPSTSTVQQPHWPCGLQPSLGPLRPRRSRSASSSDAPSSGTSTWLPSTVKAMVAEAVGSGTGPGYGSRSGRPEPVATATAGGDHPRSRDTLCVEMPGRFRVDVHDFSP
nr:hypothetical protein [Aquihabitans sp. G128]